MKRGIFFEDLCCHQFVMTVEENGERLLELRQWTIEEGESGFDKFRVREMPTREAMYQWLAERSKLIATAIPTPRWTDREWVTEEEINHFRTIIDNAVAESRARRKEAQ